MYTHEPLSGHLLAGFRSLAKEEGQAFLARLDSWLTEQLKELRKRRRQAAAPYQPPTESPDAKHVGVGVYWFEKDPLEAEES